MRTADALVRAIVASGTRHVFTLSGNQIMSLFDAAIDVPLELIHVRHEAAAVHAADAIGRLSGRPGVAMVTAGPGFANTLSALYVAQCAESPLVLLSGASPSGRPGAGAFQEMDQAGLAAKVCKASWTCTDPERMAGDFARAWRCAASGRPGPVHVALPVDVLESVVTAGESAVEPDAGTAPPAPADLAAVCRSIDDAARPLVIAGPPYRRRHAAAATRLLGDTGVAVVAMDSPRGLRDPALGAFAEAVAEADLVVLLGKRLDHMLELGASPPFAPGCRFMQVDPEPEALRQAAGNAGDRMLLQVQGDPAGWAAAMAERLAGCSLDAGWRATVDAAVAYRPAEWRGIGSDSPVHPAQLGYAVHDFLAGSPDSVFVSDGGEIGQWAQACVNAPHRIINGPAGAIGSALPFALAARTLFPQARIAATLGDGTFGFHPLEIDTAVRHEPAVRGGGRQRRPLERGSADPAPDLWGRPRGRLRAARQPLRRGGSCPRRPRRRGRIGRQAAGCVGGGARVRYPRVRQRVPPAGRGPDHRPHVMRTTFDVLVPRQSACQSLRPSSVRSVGIEVLSKRLSEYVRLAAAGETVLVTDGDRVVADICPRRGVFRISCG